MDHTGYIHLLANLPQVTVLCYALRLTRRFGTERVGWILVASFTALAAFYLLLFSDVFFPYPKVQIRMEIAYGFNSLFLLTVLIVLELLLNERARARKIELQAQADLEARVLERTTELTNANQELEKTSSTLQSEIDERKRIQDEADKTHKELLSITRQAGMSEVATGVLHNVGNVLNSVNVSAGMLAEHLRQSKVEYVSHVAKMLKEHRADAGEYLTKDPRGSKLPDFLAELAEQLDNEQILLIRESNAICNRIEHIKQIVATQQSYGNVSGVAERVKLATVMEDVLRIKSSELDEHGVQIRRDYAPQLPEIIVDKHKVLQILLNLVSNAKHACADSGRDEKQVTVRLARGDNTVCIAVQDNGVGIAPANLNKVFNHGFTTRKTNNGHGFGLHSGALAARQIGGKLTAHSDGLNQGATFTLELPLKPI